VWHRRSGKDELALHWTAVSMFQRVGNYWHTLPKANQARKALWEAVNPHSGKRRIDEAFPKEIRASTNDHEMLIRVRSGSTWQVVGSDNFDSLVGSPPVGIVMSEWALCNQASWAYLRPILAENGGWALFNTTPRGRNHAWRTFQAAQHEPGHLAQLLPAAQTGVFTQEQLDTERRQLVAEYGPEYGEALYEQEYECSFAAANLGAVLGRAIARAEAEGRIGPDVEFEQGGAEIEITSDIGFRDTAAWWFWQPKYMGFTIADYVQGSGLDAEEWIERLQKHVKDRGLKIGRIWLPHDATAKTFRSRVSVGTLFSQAFEGLVAIVPHATKSDQINAARVVAQRCEWNDVRCAEGLDGLREWSFEYDEEAKTFSKEPRHDWASHPGDAFAYGALMMRERWMEPQKPKRPHPHAVINIFAEEARPRSRYRV
jgi:hypothetical protein